MLIFIKQNRLFIRVRRLFGINLIMMDYNHNNFILKTKYTNRLRFPADVKKNGSTTVLIVTALSLVGDKWLTY